jgi:hypothetical protein
MTAKSTIETLGKLIDKLQDAPEIERISLCMTIDAILDKLDEWASASQDAKDGHPCPGGAGLFITEMKAPLYSIAGLFDYGHSHIQCILWLKSGLSKMSGQNCFAIK